MKGYNWRLVGTLRLVLFLCVLTNAGNSFTQALCRRRRNADDVPWDYSKNAGQLPIHHNGTIPAYPPENWVELGYKDCGGNLQSPIYIKNKDTEVKFVDKPVTFHGYDQTKSGLVLKNNGKTIMLTVPGDNQLYIQDGGLDSKFTLDHIDFHFGKESLHGSEHDLDFFPDVAMEMQMVHKSADGKIVIVATLFYEQIKNNEKLTPLIQSLSEVSYKDQSTIIKDSFTLESLLLDSRYRNSFYRYTGSLTAPPCTEGVTWIIYESVILIGKTQMKYFHQLKRTPEGSSKTEPLAGNIRNYQPVNGRDIDRVLLKNKIE